MKLLAAYLRELVTSATGGWNRFWFTPQDPATLSLIRVLAGLMLLYTHLVWTIDFAGFFGEHGRISTEFAQSFHDPLGMGHFAWSLWFWIKSASLQPWFHLGGLAIFLLLTVGFQSRIMAVLAFLLTISYVHRAPGVLFGLDQINTMLAMYLMVGPCGARYSVDAWRAAGQGRAVTPSVTANLAIRLLQLHLCVVYLFAALGKLQGVTWWEGTAMWLALANYEYQSLDMTWIWPYRKCINALSQFTVLWELTYPALIWPRLTRPLVLALAVPLHLGIACCMGMMTFGLVMLIANLAFVPPQLVRDFLDWFPSPFANVRQGEAR